MTKNSTAFFGFLLLLLLSLSSNAQQESPPLEQEKKSWFSQTKIGISTSGFQSTLSGVRTDLPLSYGFSGYPHTIDKTYGFSVGGLMQTPIHRFFEVECGLEYFYTRQRLHFEYIDPFVFELDTSTLNIQRHYLQMPLQLNLNLQPKWMTNQFIVKGGIVPMFLIGYNDNYNDIIFEEIFLFGEFYNHVLLNSNLSFGIRKPTKKGHLEVLLFQSLELTPFVKEGGWGFYNDLYPARNSQVGIKINFFFKTLK
jgi:hypothetical protein